MQINYTTDAFVSLVGLVNYVEDKNTEGAGSRWLDRFEIFLKEKLSYPEKIKICNNLTFKRLGLRCITFNDHIVAFSLHADVILIEAILHRSRIRD